MPNLLIQNLSRRNFVSLLTGMNVTRATVLLRASDLGLSTVASTTEALFHGLARNTPLVAACREWIGRGGRVAIVIPPDVPLGRGGRALLREVFPGVRLYQKEGADPFSKPD